VAGAAPRLGPVRLVCVDGPAGSGKTTLAAALAERLGEGCAVVHMDDLYEGWSGLGGVWDRVEQQVLAPLAGGRPGRYRRYDWVAGTFAEWVDVPVPRVLVLEGCGSAPRAVDDRAVLRLFVEAPREQRLARGLARDGEDMRDHWLAWMVAEDAEHAREDTRARADVVVDGTVPLARGWLAGPVLEVAPRLLGAVVRTELADGVVAVRLTEVEAYDGANDPGSHAFRGRTPRNAVMFGPAGHLYVYRHLGLHVCANVVTGPAGRASAVLLRAGEVAEGADLARERRLRRGVVRSDVDLARGPARLAVALGLGVEHDGADLVAGGPVRLEQAPVRAAAWATGPRVGVSGVGGDGRAYPWRLWLPGEPTVSAYRAAAPRRRRPRDG
jgi:DNA-3-methyladenine glycosylase